MCGAMTEREARMKLKRLKFGKAFRVVSGNRKSPGSLVLIEHGDRHEIRNSGRTLLRTLNIYVPPAHTKEGEALPRGRK